MCGIGLMVGHLLPKQGIAGSSPVCRSIFRTLEVVGFSTASGVFNFNNFTFNGEHMAEMWFEAGHPRLNLSIKK